LETTEAKKAFFEFCIIFCMNFCMRFLLFGLKQTQLQIVFFFWRIECSYYNKWIWSDFVKLSGGTKEKVQVFFYKVIKVFLSNLFTRQLFIAV
jgi:hypothetical protein